MKQPSEQFARELVRAMLAPFQFAVPISEEWGGLVYTVMFERKKG